jgi:hypothetical protein
MHTLTLDRYHCIEDTDEGGFTSPAFLSCVVDLQARAVRATLTPHAHWTHKSDKAEVWAVEQIVRRGPAPAVDQLFLLSTMLETTTPTDLRSTESALDQALRSQLARQPRAQPQQVAAALVRALLEALAPASAGHQPPPVRLMPVAADGIYKVWYRESV